MKISRIAAGLSGAGVYRVDAPGQAFVLKISSADQPVSYWRHQLRARQLAAQAGLTPTLIHVDEARRAVLSAFVNDRSFPAFYHDPRTHDTALAQIGRLLRSVHALPLPDEMPTLDARILLADLWPRLSAHWPLPEFVSEAVTRLLTEAEPAGDRAFVLSHNDVNPSNVIYDGRQLLLLDWDAAGANDPFYDLAAIAVFLRMDDATCSKLVATYDGAPLTELTARFRYLQRLVAVFCGVTFLKLARETGHAGAQGNENVDTTLSLLEFYQQLRAGALSPATPEGKWRFGMALLKASVGFGNAAA